MFFSRVLATLGLLAVVCLPVANAGVFDKTKKQREEEKKFTAKQTAEMGIQGLQKSMQDPNFMREALAMSKDPKFMAEVKAMMSDPEFKEEMDKIMNSDVMQRSMKAASEIAKDPAKMAQLERELASVMGGGAKKDVKDYTGKENAHLGMQNLARTARNPEALKEALEMMKDPETMKEVEAMMKDPSFQAEMKRLTSDPTFKSAMSKAAMMTDEIASDPKKMKAFMEEYGGVMDTVKEL